MILIPNQRKKGKKQWKWEMHESFSLLKLRYDIYNVSKSNITKSLYNIEIRREEKEERKEKKKNKEISFKKF